VTNTTHKKTSFSKTLKYSIKKKQFRFTTENLKNKENNERVGIKNQNHSIILGKVNYLKKNCIILASEVKELFQFPNGVLYKVKSVTLIDCCSYQEVNREYLVLQDFFNSLCGRLCFFVPFDLYNMVSFHVLLKT
jgi:hypothetical protein